MRNPRIVLLLFALVLWLTAVPGPALGVQPAPECEPHVGLNHFYVVLDEETFGAVRSGEFIRSRFANVDAGLPAFREPDATSERLFLRGKNTYLELFRPDNRFGEPVGKVGIALGVDRREDLDCVQLRWTERLEGEAERSQVERQTDGAPVPWYDAVYRTATSANPYLVVWAAGYRPEFLPWLYPHRSPEENGVARSDFLVPRFAPDLLLEDVVGLVVAVPAEVRDEITGQFEAVGYHRTVGPDGLVLEGGGWSLVLSDATESRQGLLEVHIRTTHETDSREVVRLAPRSRLEIGPGRQAVWFFE